MKSLRKLEGLSFQFKKMATLRFCTGWMHQLSGSQIGPRLELHRGLFIGLNGSLTLSSHLTGQSSTYFQHGVLQRQYRTRGEAT